MQNYTTILGVIKLRSENVPYDVVQNMHFRPQLIIISQAVHTFLSQI